MNNVNEKDWFSLTFEEKLLKTHEAVLFPERMDKNIMSFTSKIVELLIERTSGMSDGEIDKFFTK